MRILSGTCLLLLLLSLTSAFAAPLPPRWAGCQDGVPEHYSATRTYVQGTVLDASADGMVLLIEQQNDVELFTPGAALERDPANRMASDASDSLRTGLAEVHLRGASGWVFIDDPDGGPQQRVRLADARQLFREGQVIQIGAVSGLRSTVSEGFAQTQSTRRGQIVPPSFETALVLNVQGWVYIRLSSWRIDS